MIRAAAENRWPESLRAHVAVCRECAAASAVAGFMHRLALSEVRPPALPDPAVLLLKARLLGGVRGAERAARPLHALQIASYMLIAAAWAALLSWKFDDLQRWILNLSFGQWQRAELSYTLLAFVVLLSSMTVMLAMHTILAEE